MLESRRGNTEASVGWFEKLAAQTRDVDPAGYVTAQQNIAATLANAKRTDEALATFEAAAAFAEDHWGPDHLQVATIESKIAQVLMLQGRVEEARDAQRAAVRVTGQANTLSLHHASALYSLALMERSMENPDAALERAREAYAVREQNGALGTTEACGLLSTLSELEREADDLDAAESFARESLALVEHATSPVEHAKPLILLAAAQLARDEHAPARASLRARVDPLMAELEAASKLVHDDAAGCLERLEALEPRVRGVGHRPMLARLLSKRASCEYAHGDDAAARHTMHRAYEASLAAGHDGLAIQEAAQIAHEIATRTEDFERAEMWLLQAEALAGRHGLEAQPSMNGILNVRGIIASRQGDSERARAIFQQLADLTRDSPSLAQAHATAMANIGVVLANDGDAEAALEQFEQAAAFAETHWGPEHLTTALERGKLAQIHYLLGDFEEARDLQCAVLEVVKRAFPVSLRRRHRHAHPRGHRSQARR